MGKQIVNSMTSNSRNGFAQSSNSFVKVFLSTVISVAVGFMIGVSVPSLSSTKINISSGLTSSVDETYIGGENFPYKSQVILPNYVCNNSDSGNKTATISAPTSPRGAEILPSKIVVPETDLYLRRLWGTPDEDLPFKPKYLAAFVVGYNQRLNIDAYVRKFSENFTIILFHYDGKVSEWDEFEWSKKVIHVSALKQAKWWYGKRFLHPDVVASYEYIFLWDEDLGVENFDPEEYLKIVKKHGLEISQPGVVSSKHITWKLTMRQENVDFHRSSPEKAGWCPDPNLPPCASFVEIMAPVFSRDAWRCVWHLIQNDLIQGWGLDFSLRKCVEVPHMQIGVVDAQWIDHMGVPSLGSQGESHDGKEPWRAVKDRCYKEWDIFRERLAAAEKAANDAQ